MVKFGQHNEAVREILTRFGLENAIDYNALKQHTKKTRIEFRDEWLGFLQIHEKWVKIEVMEMWRKVFGVIKEEKGVRGARPEQALEMFVGHFRVAAGCPVGVPALAEEAEEGSKIDFTVSADALLRYLTIFELACSSNVETLRKAVKKFDKYTKSEAQLSTELLPHLYAIEGTCSKFKEYIDVVTHALTRNNSLLPGMHSPIGGEGATPTSPSAVLPQISIPAATPPRFNTPDIQDEVSGRKRSELGWLKRVSSSFEEDVRNCLVLHRGFHSNEDNFDRPIENSLTAYESAWSAGMRYCECDISLTLDGYIILCHDANFKRLALFHDDFKSSKSVSELTLRELIALPLKSGQRPPLLTDVLQSASTLGNGSQLVVEIKPGNVNIVDALCELFSAFPLLVSQVGVVMSFDLFLIHRFAQKFSEYEEKWECNGRPKLERDARFKIMFLTESGVPKGAPYVKFNLLSDGKKAVDEWLNGSGSTLDGIYMQYENDMFTDEGGKVFQKLAAEYTIGVWGMQPDEESVARSLMTLGARFVNTDMPGSFA